MFVEILAGILVRGVIVEVGKRLTGSTFLGVNAAINILGVLFFSIAILAGEQRVGSYIGFFLIDILSVIVMIYKKNNQYKLKPKEQQNESRT